MHPPGTPRTGRSPRHVAALLAGAALLLPAAARPADLPEYRLKAAFLYNFAVFTEWPAELGPTLTVCVVGKDPFGPELDLLAGKSVGERHLAVRRAADLDALAGCQLVFITSTAISTLPTLLTQLKGATVLTVADSPGAVAQGVVLNMNVVNDKIAFEANLGAARNAHLTLSSKLLRLATDVRP